MSNEALIAEARTPQFESEHDEAWGVNGRSPAERSDLVRRLADALEAAERTPVIDREALAGVLEKFIEGLRAERRLYPDVYQLELADAVIASGLIEDKRAVQAEALEAAADICERIENDEEYGEPRGRGIQTARVVLRARAAEIREGRA